MCSPLVAKFIRERFKKEGMPQQNPSKSGVSRRNFLKFGGMTAAAAAATVGGGLAVPMQVAAQSNSSMRVVDLTQPLTDTAPTFPAFDAPSRETVFTVEEAGFYVQSWSFAEHVATHMDAPGHFIADGDLVPDLDPSTFIAPLVVIDIAARAEENPDAEVTPEDIMAWESENGEIPPGAFVAMYSGWETKYGDVQAFRGTDDEGGLHFPGISADAAAMLAEERDLVGVGVDTLSLDYGPSATFDAHYAILGAGIYGIENLAGLGEVAGRNATVFVGIPIYQDGSGGPCRVLAMVEE